MDKIALGQYYHTNSIIHRLDPRVKIVISLLYMFAIFVIPFGNFIGMTLFAGFTLFIIVLSKVPFMKFLRGIKHVLFILVLTFAFSTFFATQTGDVYIYDQNITVINIVVSLLIMLIFFKIKKYLPIKIIFFALFLGLCFIVMHYPLLGNTLYQYKLTLSKEGFIMGLFLIYRIFVLIIFSCTLTLTTKPTDINNGLESLMSPLKILKINVGIFSMMISIALRNIPTLFLEADKILKAQASRGVDFKEGKIKERIFQIIALIIPMFIVAFRKSSDIADAMEARGYIPGAERTKLAEMRLKQADFIGIGLFLLIIGAVIYLRITHAI